MNDSSTSEKTSTARGKWQRIAIALWVLPMFAIAAWVIAHPLYRSTTPIYHEAVANWWARRPVYFGASGFNYLPTFLPFFGLFSHQPLVLGEILWRWLALAGLCFGLWKCTRFLATTDPVRALSIVTLLSLPIGLSSLRNGQSSAQLAACLVLTAWCLHEQRWWQATLWLALSLVCKPLGLPAIGLAAMAFPRMGWRLLFGTALVLVVPYALAPAGYVNELYVAFARNIAACFSPAGRTFADLNGVLMAFNLRLDGLPSLMIRVMAGGALAIVSLMTRRAMPDDQRALTWLGLSASYIMLFTPMNEGNSYVMLAPSLGLWTWWNVENGRRLTARLIALMAATMVVLPDIVGLVLEKQDGSEFAKFLYPFVTLVFLATLLRPMRYAWNAATSEAFVRE